MIIIPMTSSNQIEKGRPETTPLCPLPYLAWSCLAEPCLAEPRRAAPRPAAPRRAMPRKIKRHLPKERMKIPEDLTWAG